MASQDNATQVLLVEDDPGVIKFVRTVLEQCGHDVTEARDGRTALELAAAAPPDLVVLDLSLPELGGLEVCRRIRTWFTGPVLVLSGDGNEATIVRALDEGADDYLTKPFRSSELPARIRALLRRIQTSGDNTQMELGDLRIDVPAREVAVAGEPARLTKTEFEILVVLASNRGRVMTAGAILRQVWGPYHGEYSQSLRVHIGHIRRKIEPDPSAPRYILTEAGVGYRFASGEQSSRAHA